MQPRLNFEVPNLHESLELVMKAERRIDSQLLKIESRRLMLVPEKILSIDEEEDGLIV
jgi:hypothetical protein